MKLAGAPGNGRQAVLRLIGLEIPMEKCFKALDNSFVDMIPGDELPVVEADAVAKEQLDIRCDQGTAVLVDRLIQFVLDLREAIQHDLPFLFRQMERLIYIIGEERIILNVFTQRRSLYEIRVKNEHPSFWM